MPPMSSHTPTFTEDELLRVIDEATLYLCACPAQVAAQILRLRQLIQYQQDFTGMAEPGQQAHQLIAQSCEQAQAELERCLSQVLEVEGWDRRTLTMPPGIRQRRDKIVQAYQSSRRPQGSGNLVA